MALCLGVPARVGADKALELTSVKPGQVRVDGQLGEWRGVRFASLGDGDSGASIEYALAFEDGRDAALYVGARVLDDDFVRTARPGPADDAVVLTLSMPRASGGFVDTHVWLFAGVVGRSPASAALSTGTGAPRTEARVKVVEGPLRGAGTGYVLEARIPLSAIPGGRELQLGRGAVLLHDVDRGGGKARRIASAKAPQPLGVGANAALYAFLHAKNLTESSLRHDLIGDVFGDRRLERVVLAETFAVVVGPDVQGGQGFHYVDLPVLRGSAIREASLRDLTGDGKRELMVVLRQENAQGSRDLMQVWDLARQQATTRFAVELRKQTAKGEVSARLRIVAGKRGRAPALVVEAGQARGLSADNYHEQRARDAEPILLPFGKVKSRTYRWDGARFAVEKEVDNEAYVAPATAGADATQPAQPTAPPRRATHQKPPGVDALVAAFRQARGIAPQTQPRFVRHVNLAEDAQVESLMLFGKHLLVLGKGFRGGSGFFYFELPVAAASDIQRLFTGDVTGDGRREVFVRFKQLLSGPDGEPVQREILLGYTFAAQALQPILAVEVRRAQGQRSVGNLVKLVPDSGHWALVVSPGRAHGWSQDSYPFIAESIDGYQRILLPWRDRPVRYQFDGATLSAR